jgi:hypothetical protein
MPWRWADHDTLIGPEVLDTRCVMTGTGIVPGFGTEEDGLFRSAGRCKGLCLCSEIAVHLEGLPRLGVARPTEQFQEDRGRLSGQ